MAMVLFLVDFSKTNGGSVAVDSKESNSETGSNSISDNGGIVEGKLDPRISGSIKFPASFLLFHSGVTESRADVSISFDVS